MSHPAWVDEYAKAMHHGFENMVPAKWGPLDQFQIFGLLNSSFIKKIHKAVKRLEDKGVSHEEAGKTFCCPSSLRGGILFPAVEYQYSSDKNKDRFREVIEYLVGCLKAITIEDAFAKEKNVMHTQKEINDILEKEGWQEGTPEAARELGKLYNSLSAFSYSLYRDFFPQESNEIYGPYDASEKFGEDDILLIKHLMKLNPEFWPDMSSKYDDIKFFQVYENLSYKCEITGMHSIYDGSLIDGLKAFKLVVDGEQVNDLDRIDELSTYFAELATEQIQVYDDMSDEEIKEKVLKWLCYQFNKFFELAGMDWKPTQEMLDAVEGGEVRDHAEFPDFPSYEEFVTSPDYEVKYLRELYE